MSRLTTVLVFLSSCALAFTDLTVDPDMVMLGESFTVDGACSSPGAEVAVTVFLDNNGNGAYDDGIDFMTFSPEQDGPLVDGGGEPDDTRDGRLTFEVETGEVPFPFAGRYVSYFEDDSGADTVRVVVAEIETGISIAGTVSGPDGPMANVAVGLDMEYCDADDNCEEGERIALTDDQGRYAIYLPDDMAELYVEIGPVPELGPVDSSLAWPASRDYEVAATLSDVDFTFTRATKFIDVLVKDENDGPVEGVFLAVEGPFFGEHIYRTTSEGRIRVPASEGSWYVRYDEHESAAYMAGPALSFEVSEQQGSIDTTLAVLTADQTIGGTVSDETAEGFDLNAFQVEVEGYFDPEQRYRVCEQVDDDGAFSLDVHGMIASYRVRLSAGDEDFPPEYYLVDNFGDAVAPGKSDLSAEVRDCEGGIMGTIVTSDGTTIENAGIAVEPRETEGGVYFVKDCSASDDGLFAMPLPNGTYDVTISYGVLPRDTVYHVEIADVVILDGYVEIGVTGGVGQITKARRTARPEQVNRFRVLSGPRRRLSVTLAEPAHVTVVLYDTRGRSLRVVGNKVLAQGGHCIPLTPSSGVPILPAGMYIVTLDLTSESGVWRYRESMQIVE